MHACMHASIHTYIHVCIARPIGLGAVSRALAPVSAGDGGLAGVVAKRRGAPTRSRLVVFAMCLHACVSCILSLSLSLSLSIYLSLTHTYAHTGAVAEAVAEYLGHVIDVLASHGAFSPQLWAQTWQLTDRFCPQLRQACAAGGSGGGVEDVGTAAGGVAAAETA